MHYTDQSPFDARFEWGQDGLRSLGPDAAVVVIVDVLSFTTAVDVAIRRGATVFPYRWRQDSAMSFAESRGALLAVNRRNVDKANPYSLSPESLLKLPPATNIVLPSPNGSTLSAIASEFDAAVFAGCLRNATSVAAACRAIAGPIAVIAAGERWEDVGSGSLRPALEDLIGAGAILDAFQPSNPSPEASAAIAAFQNARDQLQEQLLACASGRELVEIGYQRDVEIAAALNASSTAPRLQNGAFTHALP